MKDLNNLRVYKVILADGSTFFECRLFEHADPRRSTTPAGIGSIANGVVSAILNQIQANDIYNHTTIDLRPFHDIECPKGQLPYRCFALTSEEAMAFWIGHNLIG